ncbi:MAG TPA: efflux RND transporter permease subunit [Leptolyngbyaceae cyanobacterium M65_K2018_010]|nr:efflux RND transporter permease subunit [Leptolyngbyaceae cyanobacterium M65_K2018_010]
MPSPPPVSPAPPPLRDRVNLSRWAINHAGLTIGFWLAISVAGWFAFRSLQYALFPDITFPVVVVNSSAPLATALETETQLTAPLEAELETLPGLNRIFSTTYAGQTVLTLRFQVGTDLEASTTAVEEALADLDLPAASRYQVTPLNLNEEATVTYALGQQEGDLSTLAALAEAEMVPRLEAIPGVLRVDVQGTAGQHSFPPAGVAGPPADPDPRHLLNPPTLVRFNGTDALALRVIKRGEANTLALVQQVETAMQDVQAAQPQVQVIEAVTQANFIRESTRATIDSLLSAIVIAVLVIFAFLKNWRATLITALAIPISLLGTCIVMALSGFNLETITLLALALVIGIVVDDAIVEVENIIRHLEAGATPKQAALAATREIGLTVSAATLTIVAVFLPVALMGGTVGQFFKPFGLTVSAAVLTSLLVARTLSPVLAVYWLRKPSAVTTQLPRPGTTQGQDAAADPPPPTPVEAAQTLITEVSPQDWLSRGYGDLLNWALGHRWAVVGLAIASLVAGIALIPLVPKGFIPQLDRGEFNVTFLAPPANPPDLARGAQAPNSPGTLPPVNPLALALAQTQPVAQDLEAAILDHPAVESMLTTIGVQGQPNRGQIYVKLKGDRSLTTAQVQDQLRATLPQLAGVTTSVEDLQFVDTGGEKPLQVVLVGADLEQLNQAATTIQAQLLAQPEFADVSVTVGQDDNGEIAVIHRRSGQRVAYVTANLSAGQALGNATEQVVAIAQGVIPPGVTLDLGGDSARLKEVLGSFGTTLALGVACMIAVLLVPFGRLLEPAVVGLSLPFALVGALLALLITQSAFGMISVIGLLFLLGLLDKNALLLMDYINQLRQAGFNRHRAIQVTGQVRLRPILMTTASTILGMLPIALGLGAGAELRQPMAVAIIGGLMTSTLLSLLVVPVLYTLLEDGWQRLVRQK